MKALYRGFTTKGSKPGFINLRGIDFGPKGLQVLKTRGKWMVVQSFAHKPIQGQYFIMRLRLNLGHHFGEIVEAFPRDKYWMRNRKRAFDRFQQYVEGTADDSNND